MLAYFMSKSFPKSAWLKLNTAQNQVLCKNRKTIYALVQLSKTYTIIKVLTNAFTSLIFILRPNYVLLNGNSNML